MKNRDSYDFMKDMKQKMVMTEGNIVKILIMFILPMIGSSIFQQLYGIGLYGKSYNGN